MSNKITFWQLIEENKIEIPVIQRDYAQGREEDKVNSIRKEFITDLISTLEKAEKTLHLGFVYGKIEGKDKYIERERNKRAIENILHAVEGYAQQLDMHIKTDISILSNAKFDAVNLPNFIPLDGQQRLTTLFLLHWYLVVFTKNQDSLTQLKTLRNFTYKTRKSSLEFCYAINQLDNYKSLKDIKGSLSESLQNQKWFRKIWMRDSTVKGMLVMLDEIHGQLSDSPNRAAILNKLLVKENPPISFDFLDLNELNQTDELYVKMNARGKQLSEFEHFKAWIQHYVSTKKVIIKKESVATEVSLSDLIEEKEWKLKLDRTWLDLFWKNKELGVYYIDDVIYNAFKQIALLAYIADKGKSVDEDVTKVVRENSYHPFSYFDTHDFFNAETLNFLFKSLNSLCDKHVLTKYEGWLGDITNGSFFGSKLELSSFFLKNDKTIDRAETIFYYSFLLFLNNSQNSNSEDAFKIWMRFTRNIIFNTYIQNPENFIEAILSLNALKEHIDSIDTYIANPGTKISFFGDAVRQEVLKFNLIRNNTNWEQPIKRFENHLYFKGDIDFLLELSKVEGDYNLEDFELYGEIASLCFDDSIRNHPQKILQRALLTHGDYLPSVGPNHLLPLSNGDSLRARRDNWQRVFNIEESRKILKLLFDNLKNDSGNIENLLSRMIENYATRDWTYYFVKSEKVVNYCTLGFIRFEHESDILLLKTSRVYGIHAELRSYFAYSEGGIEQLETFSPFTKREYWSNRMSQYEFPCIRLNGWEYEGKHYNLEITFMSDNKYLMQLINEEKVNISKKIRNLLVDLKWQLDKEDTRCFIYIDDDSEIKPQTIDLLNKLSKIL